MRSNSKSARNSSPIRKHNRFNRDVAFAPATLVNEGVDAIIEVQKNTLDAAAHYSTQAVELWKQAFYFTFGTPSKEQQQKPGAGKVLAFRSEPQGHGTPKRRSRQRRSRSRSHAA